MYGWMGKVTHKEFCKKLKLYKNTERNMHKQESVLEKEQHKILWDFEIKLDLFFHIHKIRPRVN